MRDALALDGGEKMLGVEPRTDQKVSLTTGHGELGDPIGGGVIKRRTDVQPITGGQIQKGLG